MSIRFPDVHQSEAYTVDPAVKLAVPADTFPKPTGDMFFGFFFRVPSYWWHNSPANIVTAAGGSTGGNDHHFSVVANPDAGEYSFQCRCARGGQVLINSTSDLTVRAGTAYFGGLIIINQKPTLFVCEPGGSASVFTGAAAAAYMAIGTGQFCETFGHNTGTANSPWPGHLADVAMIEGTFPNTADVPTASVIEAIAAGTTTYDALATTMSGTKKSWYPLANQSDLSDAWGNSTDLTTSGENAADGHVLLRGDQLRPNGLAPTFIVDCVSNATWGTAGDIATATADIVIPGGTYDAALISGTPDAVEARLVDQDSTEVVGWTEIDGSLSGGTFSGHTFSSRPASPARWLQAEYRIVDSGDAELVRSPAGALRGVGICVLLQGQSQVEFLMGSGETLNVLAGTRAIITRNWPEKAVPVTGNTVQCALVSPGDDPSHSYDWGDGIVQFFREIHNRHDGLPVQVVDIAISGHSLSQYANNDDTEGVGAPGSDGFRLISGPGQVDTIGNLLPAPLAYVTAMFGHSNEAAVGYDTSIDGAVARWEGVLGAAQKTIQCPVQRNPSATGSVQQDKREKQWDWVQANSSLRSWGLNFNNIYTVDGVHPDSGDAKGVIRSGAQLAWAVMMGAGATAVPNIQLRSATLKAGGTECDLTFGA